MDEYSLSLKALTVTILLALTGAILARVKPEDFGIQEDSSKKKSS